jgi:hypothetical protein
MIGAVRKSLMSKRVLAALFLLAMALRVLAPAGFMPEVGDRGLVLRLCSGSGAQTVVVVPGKTTPDEPQNASGETCLFGAAPGQGLVMPAALPAMAAMLPRLPLVFATAIAHLTVHRLAAPPPPSQAPPAQG